MVKLRCGMSFKIEHILSLSSTRCRDGLLSARATNYRCIWNTLLRKQLILWVQLIGLIFKEVSCHQECIPIILLLKDSAIRCLKLLIIFDCFSSIRITSLISFFIPFPSAQLKLFITKWKWVSCFHLLKFEVQRLNAFIQWHFPKGKGYFSWCIEEHLESISVRGKSVQIFCLLLFLASFCYLSELPPCALRALYSSASGRCRALIATEYSGRAAERREEICLVQKRQGAPEFCI